MPNKYLVIYEDDESGEKVNSEGQRYVECHRTRVEIISPADAAPDEKWNDIIEKFRKDFL